VADASSVGLLL